VLDNYANEISNPPAINKVQEHLFKIRMSTLDSYILEKAGKIDTYSKILFSARKHKRYNNVRQFVLQACMNILSYINRYEKK